MGVSLAKAPRDVDAFVVSLPDGWVTQPHWGRLSDLVGQTVRVRPHYLVPNGPGESRTPVRSPWTTLGRVEEILEPGVGAVRVTHLLDGPWRKADSYFVHELHHRGLCRCEGCLVDGGGIHALDGA